MTRAVLAAVAAVALGACTPGERSTSPAPPAPPPSESTSAPTPKPTVPATTPQAAGSPEPSVVTTSAPAPVSEIVAGEGATSSSVEVVVAETLSEFDANETPEGTVLTVPEQVLFDFNSAELRPEAESALADLAEVLRYYEGAPVEIRGHTDAIGSDADNQGLSDARAGAVLRHFVDAQGIDESLLSTRGFGESQPVAPNTNPDGSDNPEGRQANRRVEIVIDRAGRAP